MYLPSASLLRGEPYARVRNYGMPHINAFYASDTRDVYSRTQNALCAVCFNPAVHTHHEPNKGTGGRATFALTTNRGVFALRPALIALCPRCHDLRHAHKIAFRWEWDLDKYAQAWFEGDLLADGIKPHSKRLYDYGCWHIQTPWGDAQWRERL